MLIALMVLAGAGAYHRERLIGFYKSKSQSLRPKPQPIGATHLVSRGELTVTVRETGTIQAVKSTYVTSDVEGQARIIKLVPEGQLAQKGDLLIELDSSNLRDQLSQQEIATETARAGLTEAQETLEIQKNQNRSDIDKSGLKVEFAELDLKKYREGEWPQMQREAQTDITIAEEELKRARNRLKWTEKLEKEGYVTRTELEADELAVKKGELAVERAKEKLRILEEFSHPKKVREMESTVEESKRELERVIHRAKAELLQKDANLRAKESAFAIQEQKLKKVQTEIEKCKLYAPSPGLVVYYSEGRRWGNNEAAIEEGSMVRQLQKLIQLPDVSMMRADVKVHESVIDKIALDQVAYITADAFPGKRFVGHVKKVAPIADSQNFWLNPDLKVYNTEVLIDSEAQELKPGMSSMVEIICAELKDVVTVPVQAVGAHNGQECCYVVSGENIEMHAVLVGPSNEKHVVIKEGVKEGDRVLLYTPEPGTPLIRVGFDRISSAPEVVAISARQAEAKEESAAEEMKDASMAEQPIVAESATSAQPDPKGPMESPRMSREFRERMGKMSSEEREETRKRWMNASPEQRQKLMEQSRGNQGPTRP